MSSLQNPEPEGEEAKKHSWGRPGTLADSGSTDIIDDLLSWFVPTGEDYETQRRAWRVAGSTIFMILVCLVFITLDLFRKLPLVLPLALMVAAAFGGVILTVLKKMSSPRLAGHMLCSGIIAVLSVQCIIDSGSDNPSVIPILLVPWIAAICLGGREACIYAGLGTLFFALFYTLSAQGYHFAFNASEAHVRIFLLVMCFIMIWTVAGIGYTYEKYRRKAWAVEEQLTNRNEGGLRAGVFRALVSDMRPFVLDTLGLATAIVSEPSSPKEDLAPLAMLNGNGDGATERRTLQKRHAAPLIQENSYQLLAMLNTADELAEIEQKRSAPVPERISVPSDVEDTLLPLREMAERRGLGLWIEGSDLQSHSVYTDLLLLEHLLNLLVERSLERLRSGYVTISFSLKGRGFEVNVEAVGPKKSFSLSQQAHDETLLHSHVSQATANRLAEKIGGRLEIYLRPPETQVCRLTVADMRE